MLFRSEDATGSTSEFTVNANAANFPKLRRLSMRGFCLDLLKCAMNWNLPNFTHLTVDFEDCHIDKETGISTILDPFGSRLTTLNINAASINFNFHDVLLLCPRLENVSFDLTHWVPNALGNETRSLALGWHPSLKTVGLHGPLKFLYSSDFRINTFTAYDARFRLLLDRKHFPNQIGRAHV